MNNNCPSCGALYNVAPTDVGRRLKCKKCFAALRVAESGLELDSANPAEEPLPPEPEPERNRDEPPSRRKRLERQYEREREPRFHFDQQRVREWLPTALFAAGVFFVIVFTAFPIIGKAGSERANAYQDYLKNAQEQEKFDLRPRKPESEWTDTEKKRIQDETPRIDARYSRLAKQAALDAESTRISNIRDVWYEQYGLMFGFIMVAFGCIGYLRLESSLVMKIIAGTILTLMMLALFAKFTGCTGLK